MNKLKLKYLIENEQLLREFLLENNISRKTLTRIKFDNDGSIKVNGKEENVRYILKKNDIVEINLVSMLDFLKISWRLFMKMSTCL